MPDGSEFQTEGAAMLKPREATIVILLPNTNKPMM